MIFRASLLLAAMAACPADAACRLALMLALDVSASVDAGEDGLQREGLARALLAPDVQSALLAQADRPVTLSVFEWSGRYDQVELLPWTELGQPDDIARSADRLRRSLRGRDDSPTALGYALGYAAIRFRDGPDCSRKILDVSGDGLNNEGFGPQIAFNNFPFDGITVNGLAIGGEANNLAGYYRNELIRGPGAFVEAATDFSKFEAAMRRKLLRELDLLIGMLPPPPAG